MPFIPSSVPKLPLSMEPSRGKMMKSDNPAPDSENRVHSRNSVEVKCGPGGVKWVRRNRTMGSVWR